MFLNGNCCKRSGAHVNIRQRSAEYLVSDWKRHLKRWGCNNREREIVGARCGQVWEW